MNVQRSCENRNLRWGFARYIILVKIRSVVSMSLGRQQYTENHKDAGQLSSVSADRPSTVVRHKFFHILATCVIASSPHGIQDSRNPDHLLKPANR